MPVTGRERKKNLNLDIAILLLFTADAEKFPKCAIIFRIKYNKFFHIKLNSMHTHDDNDVDVIMAVE